MDNNKGDQFNKPKVFNSVTKQRGRVPLDDDFKEMDAVTHHNIESLLQSIKTRIDSNNNIDAADRKVILMQGFENCEAKAQTIAVELGKELHKVDLGKIISKYIGETEKNLAHLFAEAEQKDWILFFDEADALFGKRTDVHDANDRYSNSEIAYLLQKLEAYKGFVIVATKQLDYDTQLVQNHKLFKLLRRPDE